MSRVPATSTVPETPGQLAAVSEDHLTTHLVTPVEVCLVAAEIRMGAVVMNTALATLAAVSADLPTTRRVTPMEACPAVTITPTEVEATRMALVVKRLARTPILEVPTITIRIRRTLEAEVSYKLQISNS